MRKGCSGAPVSRVSDRIVLFGWLVVISLLLTFAPGSASTLKKDEEVIFFPTSASLDEKTGEWNVPIHGWVFEPEESSVWRSALTGELVRWLEIDEGSVENDIFRQRARMFLVDNERGKQFRIWTGGKTFQTARSGPNGHFYAEIRLEKAALDGLTGQGWLHFHVDPAQAVGQNPGGRIQIVQPTGFSVISDIDDTIKISNVLDKGELLENTFLKEFRPVPGMSEAYHRWAEKGAVFHYVSASPWQLYPALGKFMQKWQFPEGSFSLKMFRLKDSTFFNLFASSEKGKTPAIESIIRRYPERQFILVGDSGEHDPEIYGDIARRFPEQVNRIFIRNVPGSDDAAQRFGTAFKGLDDETWTVFSDPGELEGKLDIKEYNKEPSGK